MAQWRRGDKPDEMQLAAGVPDAQAVLDADGGLVGWDETDAQSYIVTHQLGNRVWS